jgi:hypothetical protein
MRQFKYMFLTAILVLAPWSARATLIGQSFTINLPFPATLTTSVFSTPIPQFK